MAVVQEIYYINNATELTSKYYTIFLISVGSILTLYMLILGEFNLAYLSSYVFFVGVISYLFHRKVLYQRNIMWIIIANTFFTISGAVFTKMASFHSLIILSFLLAVLLMNERLLHLLFALDIIAMLLLTAIGYHTTKVVYYNGILLSNIIELVLVFLALGLCTRVVEADIIIGAPTNLGPIINTSSADAGPSMSADGLELYLDGDRPGTYGSWDLWIATRATTNDPWGDPVNLGPSVNSAMDEIWNAVQEGTPILILP